MIACDIFKKAFFGVLWWPRGVRILLWHGFDPWHLLYAVGSAKKKKKGFFMVPGDLEFVAELLLAGTSLAPNSSPVLSDFHEL